MTVISKNLGLIQGVHTGVTPPSNTFMIWVDTSTSPQSHKVYDNIATTWINIKPSSLIREAVKVVFDDAGNALPNNTATAIDDYTITDTDRVIVLDSLSGTEINKIFVASVTGSSIVWNVTQDGSGADIPVAGTTTWVINGTIYGSSQAIFDDTTWQFHDPHTQNTDTGTTQSNFDIDSQGTGVKLKNVVGELQLRDLIDTTWADLRVGNLTVEGTQTIVNSEIVEIADNIIILNSNVTSGAPSEDGGVHIRRGDEDNASMLWNETLDKWTAGIDGSELPILLADQANTLSSNTSFVMGDYGLELNTTEFKLEHNVTNDIKSVGVTSVEAFLQADNGTNISKFSADVTNGVVITDDIYNIGVVYESEYTAPSDRKWLTHKGYVDDLVTGASPFEYDGVQSVRVKGYQGVGTVDMVNGSGAISGNGTNFLDGTPYTGVAWWGQIWVHDSVQWHRIIINPTAATNASIYDSYNESKIKSGYLTTSATFEGITGTYDFYVTQQIADDGGAFSIGNNGWAEDLGTALGSGVATGNMALATGQETLAEGIQGSSFNKWTRAEGDFSFAGGLGQSISTKQIIASGQTSFNFSENTIAQTAGYGALADNSAILGGIDNHIPANSPRSVIIGGSGIVADAALADMVYVPNLRIPASAEIQFGTTDTTLKGNGTNIWFTNSSGILFYHGTLGFYIGSSGNSGVLRPVNSSSTIPSLVTRRPDLGTGIGGDDGEVDLITDSVSRLNISDTLITANEPIRISTIGDALEFGDGDTKFYESLDDVLRLDIGSASTQVAWTTLAMRIGGSYAPSIRMNASSTLPSYGFDAETLGMGRSAVNQLSFYANSVDIIQFTETLQTFSTVVSGVEPTIEAHLATKGYVDRIASQDSKDSAELATTASITLSGEQTIDGILTSASRILVKNQGTASENGIYVTDSSTWSRSDDADDDNEVTSGMRIWVDSGGTANGNTEWTLTTANPIIVGTTGLTFTKTGEAGYIDAQNGLTKNGNFIELGGTLLGATDIDTDTYALSFSGTGGLDLKGNELSSSTSAVAIAGSYIQLDGLRLYGSGTNLVVNNVSGTTETSVQMKTLRLRDSTFFTVLSDSAVSADRAISLPDLDGTVMLNLVEDTSPQLGGNLDLQSFNVIGSGVANTTSGFTLGSDTLWLNHATNSGMEIDFGATDPSVRRKDGESGIILDNDGVHRLISDVANVTVRSDDGNDSLILGGGRQSNGGAAVQIRNLAATPFVHATGYQSLLNLDTTTTQSGTASFDLIVANLNLAGTESGETNILNFSVGGSNRFKVGTDGYIFISAPQTASVSDDEFLVRTSTGEIKQRNIDDIAGDHALGSHSDTDFTGLADNDLMYRSGGEWIDTNGALTYDGTDLAIDGEIHVHSTTNPTRFISIGYTGGIIFNTSHPDDISFGIDGTNALVIDGDGTPLVNSLVISDGFVKATYGLGINGATATAAIPLSVTLADTEIVRFGELDILKNSSTHYEIRGGGNTGTFQLTTVINSDATALFLYGPRNASVANAFRLGNGVGTIDADVPAGLSVIYGANSWASATTLANSHGGGITLIGGAGSSGTGSFAGDGGDIIIDGGVKSTLGADGNVLIATNRGQALFANGSVSAPSIAFVNDTNGGLYWSSASNILITAISGTGIVGTYATGIYPIHDTTRDLGKATSNRWRNLYLAPTGSSTEDNILTVNTTTGLIEYRLASSLGAEHNLTDHLDVNTTGLATGSLLYFDSANWVDTGTDLLWDGDLSISKDGGSSSVGDMLTITGTNQPNTRSLVLGVENLDTYINHTSSSGTLILRNNSIDILSFYDEGLIIERVGSVTQPSLRWTGDADTGFYYAAVADFYTTVGGFNSQRWNANNTIFYKDDGTTAILDMDRATGYVEMPFGLGINGFTATSTIPLNVNLGADEYVQFGNMRFTEKSGSENWIQGYTNLGHLMVTGGSGTGDGKVVLYGRTNVTQRGFVLDGGNGGTDVAVGSIDSYIEGHSNSPSNTTAIEGGSVYIDGGAKATAGTSDGDVLLATQRGRVQLPNTGAFGTADTIFAGSTTGFSGGSTNLNLIFQGTNYINLNSNNIKIGKRMQSSVSTGFRFDVVAATAIVPTLLPNYSSDNTGIGGVVGTISAIVGGVEGIHIATDAYVSMPLGLGINGATATATNPLNVDLATNDFIKVDILQIEKLANQIEFSLEGLNNGRLSIKAGGSTASDITFYGITQSSNYAGIDISGGTLLSDLAVGDINITGPNALSSASTNQDGGNVIIDGGVKASGGGVDGNVLLAMNRGNVYTNGVLTIGASSFTAGNLFEVHDAVDGLLYNITDRGEFAYKMYDTGGSVDRIFASDGTSMWFTRQTSPNQTNFYVGAGGTTTTVPSEGIYMGWEAASNNAIMGMIGEGTLISYTAADNALELGVGGGLTIADAGDVTLDVTARTAIGQTPSNDLILTASAYDTSEHKVEWKTHITPTNDAGTTSAYIISRQYEGGGWLQKLLIDEDGDVVFANNATLHMGSTVLQGVSSTLYIRANDFLFNTPGNTKFANWTLTDHIFYEDDGSTVLAQFERDRTTGSGIFFPQTPTAGTTEDVLVYGAGGELKTVTQASLGGGGDVTASNSPSNNEIAVFTTGTDIEGQTLFTYDSTLIHMGIGTTTADNSLHILHTQNNSTAIIIENLNTGINAWAGIGFETDGGTDYIINHGSGRTATRYGTTIGGYFEILAVNASGLLIGTGNNATGDIIFGTNDNERLKIDQAGLFTFDANVGGGDADEYLNAAGGWTVPSGGSIGGSITAGTRIAFGNGTTDELTDSAYLYWSETGKRLILAGNADYPDLEFENSHSTAGVALGSILGNWQSTSVARMVLVAGDDDTNFDDGSFLWQTASAGTLVDRMTLGSDGLLTLDSSHLTIKSNGAGTSIVKFWNTANTFWGSIGIDSATSANRAYTLPNETGTIALLSDITGTIGGSASSQKIAFGNGTDTITSDTGFYYASATHQLYHIGTEGGLVSMTIQNQSTGAGGALLAITAAGGSSGDPYLMWTLTSSVASYALGIDNSDANSPLNLTYAAASASPSTASPIMSIATDGEITFNGNVGGGVATEYLGADGNWSVPSGSGIGGTIADTQIGYGNGSDTLAGAAVFTYNGSNIISFGTAVAEPWDATSDVIQGLNASISFESQSTELSLATWAYYDGASWKRKDGSHGGSAIFIADSQISFRSWASGTIDTTISFTAPMSITQAGLIKVPILVEVEDVNDNRIVTSDGTDGGALTKLAASGGGTANFLRADGTWAAPSGNYIASDGDTTLSSNVIINHTGSGTHNARLQIDGNNYIKMFYVNDLATDTNAQVSVGSNIDIQMSGTYINQIRVGDGDSGMWIAGSSTNFQGILYNADYSADYVSRSLVDKEYVDGIAGIGGSITVGQIAVGATAANDIEGNIALLYSYEGGDTPTIYTGDDNIEIMSGGLAGTSILISDADNEIAISSGTSFLTPILNLTSVPTTDVAFSTSTMLVRDSFGNVDKIVASGGSSTDYLSADGTWTAPTPYVELDNGSTARHLVFVDSNTASYQTLNMASTIDLTYTPNTGVLSANRFSSLAASNNYIFIWDGVTNTGLYWNNTNTDLEIRNVGSAKFYFSMNDAKATAVDWTSTSDERLKTDFRAYGSVLDSITACKGYLTHFKWIETGDDDVGITAQKLEAHFPEFVNYSKGRDEYSVSYNKLSIVALEGIAELRDEKDIEIKELKDRVSSLEKFNKKLKTQLNL